MENQEQFILEIIEKVINDLENDFPENSKIISGKGNWKPKPYGGTVLMFHTTFGLTFLNFLDIKLTVRMIL